MIPCTISLTEEAIPQGRFLAREGIVPNNVELHAEFDVVEVSLERRMGLVEGEGATSCEFEASDRVPTGLARVIAMYMASCG